MTHQDITDPTIRKMYANELMVLRRAAKGQGMSPLNSPWLRGVMLGLETAFRRFDKIRYGATGKGI